MNYTLPFALSLDFLTGALEPNNHQVMRRLSHMAHMYMDDAAQAELIAQDDPLIYEVYQRDVPFDPGQLLACTTILHPGRVGDEFFMTKGHYHARPNTAEFYLGLRGHGKLLLEVEDRFEMTDMSPGTLAYIPPYWAHRTVNTGDEDFIFLSVYPADAGHNYAGIERTGFAYCIVAGRDGPQLRPNPKRQG